MAYALEDADHCFQAGEGLVRDNVEDTIRNMGYVGRVGMKDTDVTILNLMIDQKKYKNKGPVRFRQVLCHGNFKEYYLSKYLFAVYLMG